jgi:hypothetical protein
MYDDALKALSAENGNTSRQREEKSAKAQDKAGSTKKSTCNVAELMHAENHIIGFDSKCGEYRSSTLTSVSSRIPSARSPSSGTSPAVRLKYKKCPGRGRRWKRLARGYGQKCWRAVMSVTPVPAMI